MLVGIQQILISLTPRDLPLFRQPLGDGFAFGIALSYAVQPEPNGLAEAFIIGREFIGGESVAQILGDNIYYGEGLTTLCENARAEKTGATVFAYYVTDPERYGVVSFDKNGIALSVEEKPKYPKSNWAITGL